MNSPYSADATISKTQQSPTEEHIMCTFAPK